LIVGRKDNAMRQIFLHFIGAFVVANVFASQAHAASVSVTPDVSSALLSAGTTTLTIEMDFRDQPTLGGYVDLSFGGTISLRSFTPSAWWFDTCDRYINSPYGFCEWDAAAPGPGFHPDTFDGLALSLGHYDGLSTAEIVGTVTVNLLSEGVGTIGMAANSWGDFIGLETSLPMVVDFSGATVDVIGASTVPVPAAVWMFGSALGLLGWIGRKTA
jgi:hypothetical protein